MKAIKITQTILDQNNHNWLNGKQVGNIVTQSNLPNRFWVTKKFDCSYNHKTAYHNADGWRDVVQPNYNASTQKKGAIYYDENNDNFTYAVIDKTEQEIQNEIRSNSESNKQALIQEKLEADAVTSFESETDDEVLLENMDAFDFWEAGKRYLQNKKLKHISNLELKLYKVNQEHDSLDIYPPDAEGVEALYSEIAPPGVIPNWEQPTGAHNAYGIGDKVKYPAGSENVWISKIDGNTTVPDGDVPYNRYWEPFTE